MSFTGDAGQGKTKSSESSFKAKKTTESSMQLGEHPETNVRDAKRTEVNHRDEPGEVRNGKTWWALLIF